MKKIKNILLFFTLLLVSTGSIFAGGGSRNGTAGASELLIPVGARGISMGGATVTNAEGLDAVYWNPANLAREAKTDVMFSHMNYMADIGVEYGAASTNIESFGAIALSIKSLSMDDINITTAEKPDGTGSTFKPQYTTVGLTYARMLSDRIAVGLTGNLIQETIDRVSATGISFNMGISYTNLVNINGLSMAINMQNIGPKMSFDGSGLQVKATSADLTRGEQYYKMTAATFELPSTLSLGLGYKYSIDPKNQLQFSTLFQNSNFYNDEYRFGAEYGFDNTFFIRAGYTLIDGMADKDHNIYGLCAGAGINYTVGDLAVKIDYAYRQNRVFDDNHIFTLSLGF